MSSETIPEYSEKINSINSSISIEVTIAKLRVIIDQLGIHFDKAKNLISELARQLAEAKQCKQSQICRKIKDLLEDKIKEGKISKKWIEECVPKEYKRKYLKSEVSSLSKQGKKDITTTTEQQKENGLIAIEPSIKTNATSISNYGGEGKTASATNHQLQDGLNKKEFANHGAEPEVDDKYESLYAENYRLKEALAKATQFTKADQICTNEIQFTIPKEKYPQLTAAMDNSTNSVYVIFDKSGILERAEPDKFRGELHNV
jgi:phosphopantetheinyl transferase (holo-ACP synthase)